MEGTTQQHWIFSPWIAAAAESPLIVLANHNPFFRKATLWDGVLKLVLFTQFLSSATSSQTHFIFLFVIDNLIRILLDSLWRQQATSLFFGRLKHLRSDCEQNSWLMLTCNYKHYTDRFLSPKTRKLVVYFQLAYTSLNSRPLPPT
jgi:hypothetical protein